MIWMLISPGYAELCHALHQNPSYGSTGSHYADVVREKIKEIGTRDIIDYGCGKCALHDALAFPIQNYDPSIPKHSARPVPADIVVCCEVMEHIEPEYLNAVLDDIRGLTKVLLLASVSTHPANTILADGRNAHLIQQPAEWWLPKFHARFSKVTTGPTPRGPKGFAIEAWV
jgi:hypothetical protein